MINLEPIRKRLEPEFQPFRINLSDGRKFQVPHRDFIAVGRGIISLIDEEDVSHTIDALHIVSIDDAMAPPPSAD
jgi:hypothetical protein